MLSRDFRHHGYYKIVKNLNNEFMILMAQDVSGVMDDLNARTENNLNYLYYGRVFNGRFKGYYIEIYMTSFREDLTPWRKKHQVPEVRVPRDNPHDTFSFADFISLVPLSYFMEWEGNSKIQNLYLQIFNCLRKTNEKMVKGCYAEVGDKWLNLTSLEL